MDGDWISRLSGSRGCGTEIPLPSPVEFRLSLSISLATRSGLVSGATTVKRATVDFPFYSDRELPMGFDYAEDARYLRSFAHGFQGSDWLGKGRL